MMRFLFKQSGYFEAVESVDKFSGSMLDKYQPSADDRDRALKSLTIKKDVMYTASKIKDDLSVKALDYNRAPLMLQEEDLDAFHRFIQAWRQCENPYLQGDMFGSFPLVLLPWLNGIQQKTLSAGYFCDLGEVCGLTISLILEDGVPCGWAANIVKNATSPFSAASNASKPWQASMILSDGVYAKWMGLDASKPWQVSMIAPLADTITIEDLQACTGSKSVARILMRIFTLLERQKDHLPCKLLPSLPMFSVLGKLEKFLDTAEDLNALPGDISSCALPDSAPASRLADAVSRSADTLCDKFWHDKLREPVAEPAVASGGANSAAVVPRPSSRVAGCCAWFSRSRSAPREQEPLLGASTGKHYNSING
jgi:hypothetical protein